MGNSEFSSGDFSYDQFLSHFQAVSRVDDENYGEGTLLLDKSKKREVFLKEDLSLNVEDYKKKITMLKSKPSHPNIVSILGYCSKEEDKFCSRFYKCLLIFEFHRKTLRDIIVERQKIRSFFTEKELWHLISCLIFGLSHLQQLKVSHGDINPSSVLVSEDGVFKLLNPSMFAGLSSFTKVLLNNRKSEFYLSPSLMKALETNDWRPDHDPYKSDVFCLGLTILAAASLENVKSVLNFHKLVIYDDLIRDWVEGLRERYSSGFVRFLQAMLILNEEKRPDFNKLRQNLEGINLENSSKVNNESTFFKSPDDKDKHSLSGEKPNKIPTNQQFSSIRKSDYSEEERPFSTFHVKKTKSRNFDDENNNNNPKAFHSVNIETPNNSIVPQNTENAAENNKNAIEQDLESINAILDRYGITPIQRLSYNNLSNSYYVKISKEREENSNKNEEKKPNFRKKNSKTLSSNANNNLNPQNTDKNSYMLSQDFELARPYELEPDYEKYEIVIESYADKSRYEGEKIDDKRIGKGKMFYCDGTSYEGFWKNDKREGNGLFLSKENKEIYRGEFKNDLYHGKGRLHNTKARILREKINYMDFGRVNDAWVLYEGEFFKGKKQGVGVMIMGNGEKFEGQFKDDRIEGKGKFHKSDGAIVEAVWIDNKLKY